MPQEIAATLSRSTLVLTMLRLFIQPMQSASATQAPVIEAVRVPPSACSTSQSTVIWRSPSASRSRVARNERPIRRWISTVRPFCLPAEASRRVRSKVARGSMPYSAVTQPRPWPFSHGGSRSSSVAGTSTWVSPNFTRQEPSAYFTTPRSRLTARSSSGARRLGRMGVLRQKGLKSRLRPCRSASGQRQGLIRLCIGACNRAAASTDYSLLEEADGGPPRSDQPDDAAGGARAAQRALAGDFPPDRRKLPRDRRAGRLAQHLAPDRGSTITGLSAQRHGRSGAARPGLCAAYLCRPAADGTGPALLRRRPDAGRRPHRGRAAVDRKPAGLRGPSAIGRGGVGRGAHAAVRVDARRVGRAHGEIQFAAETYRIRPPGAGAGAGRAGR